MALIFSAFRLLNHSGTDHVYHRLDAIQEHYGVGKAPNTFSARYYNEQQRIGCHVLWQHFENERIERCVDCSDRLVAYTSFPFGYTKLLGSVKPAEIGMRLANLFRQDPDTIKHIHPPFTLVDLEKSTGTIQIYNDVVGYDRVFRLSSPNGFVVSNRSIPPFLVNLEQPRLSDLGWASEQLSGYMYGEVTALDGLLKNSPGTRVILAPYGVSYQSSDLIYDWFTKPPGDVFQGLDRLAQEIHTLGHYQSVDIALTGGRDSRASAAFSFHCFGSETRARTSYPPQLERDLAARLAALAPDFERFETDNLAVRKDGSTLWRAVERRSPRRHDLLKRSRDWSFILEGSGTASALYNNCNAALPFKPRPINDPSVPGIGGELAKAYAYRPMQVSGVFAPNLSTWLAEVRRGNAWERLDGYPPTTKAKIHFVDDSYWRTLEDFHVAEFNKAHDMGIRGYQFFDYWLLVGRFVGAHNPNYFGDLIMPFFTPEFMQTGAQDTLERKVNVQLSRDIVARYVPAWSSVPYFDEVQNSVPRNQLTYFRQAEMLWSGASADDFWTIIRESPALEKPYDRKRIIDHYSAIDERPELAGPSNVKAHGLVYRHSMHELCSRITDEVGRLRNIRLRQWASQ